MVIFRIFAIKSGFRFETCSDAADFGSRTTRANYDKQQSSQISAMLVDIKKALQSQADREQQNMWGGVGATSIQYEDMPIDVDEGRARRR